MELAASHDVTGLDGHRLLEFPDGLADLVLTDVDAREIEVRIVTRLVARGALGLLEPRDRLVGAPELDQVRADVIVGISERRIDRDGRSALRDGVLMASECAERPPEERVRLGARMEGDRVAVVRERFVESAFHLSLVAPMKSRARFRRHLGWKLQFGPPCRARVAWARGSPPASCRLAPATRVGRSILPQRIRSVPDRSSSGASDVCSGGCGEPS